ncbi:MAG TPA: hypothetical protein VEI02_14325, partial [Planctomycetota bacterium]|nr:hypothetical protein [Planctomycetota bacterium]
MSVPRRNPGELEIDLFCRGLRIATGVDLRGDARAVSRTRAGLGSGLELVIPGDLKDLWVNVPVEEDFAARSPYVLEADAGGHAVRDARNGEVYRVRLPAEPAWYRGKTSRGVLMKEVGVLQGTYLGVYVSNSCMFWYRDEPENCRFCTTGFNVGVNEVAQKDVEDVVET